MAAFCLLGCGDSDYAPRSEWRYSLVEHEEVESAPEPKRESAPEAKRSEPRLPPVEHGSPQALFPKVALPESICPKVAERRPEATKVAPGVEPRPEPKPPAPVAPQPTLKSDGLYHLPDSTGRVWTSPDAEWLKTWVGRVNANGGIPPQATRLRSLPATCFT